MKDQSDNKPEELITPFLESEKISLLPLKKSNAELYIKWRNDEVVRKYRRNIFPTMMEAQEKSLEPIEKVYRSVVLFEIWHNFDKKPIGLVGLNNIDYISRKAAITITIGEKIYWRKNFATIALELVIKYGFEELNLNKIYASVYETDISSNKLLEKLGMHREDILHNNEFIDSNYVDEYRYAIYQDFYLSNQIKSDAE